VKFLVDENVPGRIVNVILQRYPGSISVAMDTRFRGGPDDVLYGFLLGNPYSFLTFDADFANILRFPPAGTKGIVVVRPKGMTVDASKERVLPFLSAATGKSLADSLTIITKKSIRTKSPK
jgi:hypothetical protein